MHPMLAQSFGYLLTAKARARIHEMLADKKLLQVAEARMSDGKKPIRVTLNDL